MIKHFFTAALAAAFAAVPAGANPGQGLNPSHRAIIHAAYDAGVPVVVDPKLCQEHFMDGFYNGAIIGICTRGKGWSPNSLDTLRHEAQHLVQDCLEDGKPNYNFEGRATSFENPILAAQQAGLTEHQVNQIWVTYAGMGLEEKDILMEVEAFAVAHAIPAESITQQIREQCRA